LLLLFCTNGTHAFFRSYIVERQVQTSTTNLDDGCDLTSGEIYGNITGRLERHNVIVSAEAASVGSKLRSDSGEDIEQAGWDAD
jgi:hypothetical protein